MDYSISFKLPEGWLTESEIYTDESGAEVNHISASLPGKKGNDAMIDIYLGEMPAGDTAEDQAFSNYLETIGFNEDDPEDYNPIIKSRFGGKAAWGFDAYCEDDYPLSFISQEIKEGLLAIFVFIARDKDMLEGVRTLTERSFRLSKAK